MALVVCSLVPYLVLTVAALPLSRIVAAGLGVSRATVTVTVSMSAGAYAVGTLLAAQFATHLPPRRLLVGYEAAFFVASVLAAWAPDAPVFIVAFIAQGLLTSLMLIAAVPPLVTAWPPAKIPTSAGLLNVCIFGAVAVGPTVGALQAAAAGWRVLFWCVAAVAAAALLFSVLTFRDDPPLDPGAPWDIVALILGITGCGSAFYGAGELQASMRASPRSVVPLAAGVVLLAVLIAYEYRIGNPLVPVKALATSVSSAGIVVALTASAATFGAMELILQFLSTARTPVSVAVIFLPEFVAAITVAGLFGAVFRTRYTPLLTGGGLLMVVAGTALLAVTLPATGSSLAAVTGLLGLGVAGAVAPALFLAGLSLRARLLQRVFALIELLRAVTAFLVAPVLSFLAGVLGTGRASGTADAVVICLVIAAVGFLGGGVLYVSGRPRLEAPDLQLWQGGAGEDPAWQSPPLFSAVKRRS